jgi:hypothetical protein
MTARARFMRMVRRNRRGCWVWQGAAGRYGRFKFDGRMYQAHVWSYLYFVGEIPEGHEIDHVCRNTLCVKPAHLEAVTHKENLLRAPRQVTTINVKKTHCPRGHQYTGVNTYGKRICHPCMRIRDRARRSRSS